ncbi:hypothetical protein OG792_22195 [Micromonospora sp. NBC_01699]|uniref:RCC1 domain-containing protein n=1 Tax=Micromonospora sp. NBC_01699 TaxID=2975984 RepID=UPI002E2BED33|nr:hypothetical protein [Micromonospora sp. NBC_01699]
MAVLLLLTPAAPASARVIPPVLDFNGAVGWGENANGQVGDATTVDRDTATRVYGLTTGVKQVAAGGMHSLALLTNGTVRAWGYNRNGQLGDGTTTQRTTPVTVLELTGVTQVAAGSNYSMALRSDGTVWTWGFNTNGELGDGTIVSRSAPAQVPGLAGVTQIAAGSHAVLALRSDRTVWAWGANGVGQLGDGSTTDRLSPVPVSG